MAFKIYKNPHNVALDTASAVTGVRSISVGPASRAVAAMADDGTVTPYLANMAVAGTITFADQKEARSLAGEGGASQSLTFDVIDETGAETTVTITDCLCGDANVSFTGESAGQASVQFVGSSCSDPA